MAVGDKQKIVTLIVGQVLGEKPITDLTFDWFTNKHLAQHFKGRYNLINNVFISLGGNLFENQRKKDLYLDTDAYFGGRYNFLFEFDEFQHFSTFRLKTFDFYAQVLNLNFDISQWKDLCSKNKDKADKYRASKTTVDFNFHGGRTAQRAYFDCFRDFLPDLHGLNPTLRINEFEISRINSFNIDSYKIIERLLNNKLKYI